MDHSIGLPGDVPLVGESPTHVLRLLLLRHSQGCAVAVTACVGHGLPDTREVTATPRQRGPSRISISQSDLLVIFGSLVPPGIGLNDGPGVGEGERPVPGLPGLLVFTDSFQNPRA